MKLSTLRRAGLLSGLAVLVAITMASPVFAQQADQTGGLGLKGLGVRAGLCDSEGASSALMYGVHLDAGEFVNNVHFVPAVEYWSVGVNGVDNSDLAVRASINFDFPLQDQRMVPYLGGGFGMHRIKKDATTLTKETKDTKFGLDVQGGARNQFTPNLSLFGELGYSFVSDANQLRLLGGLTYHFIY